MLLPWTYLATIGDPGTDRQDMCQVTKKSDRRPRSFKNIEAIYRASSMSFRIVVPSTVSVVFGSVFDDTAVRVFYK